MLLNNFPWPHIVIDDYFPKNDFDLMCNEISNIDIDTYHKPISILVDDEISKYPHTYNCLLNSKKSNRAEDYLKHFKNHRNYKNLSLLQSFTLCKNNSNWPIHDEVEKKVLSVTVYVSPEKSNGTLVYDQNKNFVTEIEWKPNRAIIFCGISGITWHSYYCNSKYRASVNEFVQRN